MQGFRSPLQQDIVTEADVDRTDNWHDPLDPSAIMFAKGVSVTDGPFSEAREVIGGFALVNVADKAEAIEYGRRFAELFPEVSVEIRRVVEEEDLAELLGDQTAG